MTTGKHIFSAQLWQGGQFSIRKVSEMTNKIEYAFVIDVVGKQLSPTKVVKAWYKIRKKQAVLINKYPMVIQLKKIIPDDEICKDEIRCGIDDGGLHTGIALVQRCQSKNKVLLKGTLEHRNDVKKKMTIRRGYRRYRRYHKRYRPKRFNNGSSSKRTERLAPTIMQKRQAVLRIVSQLRKWINITSYWLEDVAIDIRALTDGYKPYRWEYQRSNRLDENIRKAVILRDECKCMECGKSNCILQVHHIKPKRLNGSDTLKNLITLCEKCHDGIKNKEELYMDKYFSLINGSRNQNLNYAQHVMIGKTWLRKELSCKGILHLTTGGDTANRRIDWNIEKTHSNDAVCITNLYPNTISVKEWCIKPIRRKSKAKTENVLGIKHKDLVEYTFKNGETHRGYVTALYPKLHAFNFQSPTKHCKKVNAKKCKLLWKYNKIYWLDNVV